jgi:hypothetical protein
LKIEKNQMPLFLACIGLSLAILVVDAYLPLGYTPWVFYLIPISLVFWRMQGRREFILISSLCMLFVLIGFVFSPTTHPTLGSAAWYIAVFNRSAGIVTFLLFTIIALRHK